MGLKFTIVGLIALHQKAARAIWFFPKVKAILNEVGYISDKKNGKYEYVISSYNEVKSILILLYPFLQLKQKQAKYVLDILFELDNALKEPKSFLALCKKADRCSALNDSKNRKITSKTVLKSFEER